MVSRRDVSIGKSSQHHNLAEFSGTFWNIVLVYKFCDILIGLQWNTFYSKSNQYATQFLQQLVLIDKGDNNAVMHH